MFILCGVFGWTGTPAAFQVVVRVVLRGVKNKLKGRLSMFSDDFHGTCFREDLEHDMGVCRQFVTSLMGPDALEPGKEVWGRKKDIIGFHIDLDTQLVSVKDRNSLRALYGFLEVDLGKPVPVTTLERLAAWGARYAQICCFMSPLVKTLNRARQGMQRWWRVTLSRGCTVVVRVFRALMLGMAVRGEKLVKPLPLFQRFWDLAGLWETGRGVVTFDASLTGVGCIYSVVVEHWGEIQVGYGAWDLTPLNFDEPAFQNVAEFIGGILAVAGAARLGIELRGLVLRGDSRTALSWAANQHFRSERVQPGAMTFVALLAGLGASVGNTDWVDGESNGVCDALSRGRGLPGPKQGEYRNTVMRDVGEELGAMDDLWELVNPGAGQSWCTEGGFRGFWGSIQNWVGRVRRAKGEHMVDEKFRTQYPPRVVGEDVYIPCEYP
jgi:hypothetical protein